MLYNLLSLFSGSSIDRSRIRDEQGRLMAQEMAPIITARNQTESPLLRLPAEIRNQICTYLDLGGHTIEVLHASDKTVDILDESGGRVHNSASSRSWQRLFFRIELNGDSKNTTTPPKPPLLGIGQGKRIYPIKRKRCASIPGLFSLPQVCRGLREDTLLLLYELNTFAFTDNSYNYSEALRSWVLSLDAPQKDAIRSISWPLRQAREYQRMLNGLPMEAPDRDCSAEFAELSGLTNVVLRWVPTDIGNGALSFSELAELSREYVRCGGGNYHIQRAFRRSLAQRGMQIQVNRADVQIEHVNTWRARF
ncbi:Nn.00g101840.m01.CDS01 [Neocucurbitaria sp. VM-36]